MGHECLSESDIEEALSSDSHTALQTQSNDEKRNFLVSRSGGRASPKSQSNSLLSQPDVRATEQGARFLPTDHRDNASDDTRQDPSLTPVGWTFCTMNMTAFSTQHLPIFELGCHVCGLQETRLTEAGQVSGPRGHERETGASFLDSLWKLCVLPGKRGQEASAIAAGPGVELQKAPLISAHEKASHDTGRYVRALVAYGKGDRVVHVVSLYGHSGAGDNAEQMRKMSSCCRDTITIPGRAWRRAMLHHISLWPCAQPLMSELGQIVQHWLQKRQPAHPCDMLCACRTWEQNRCGTCESYQQTRAL